MTLEQLRIFVVVADCLNMTRAAQTLNLTQPSVSAAIAALEGRHKLQLFDRVGRGLELSEAGRVFLTEARAVLASAQNAASALDDLAGLRRGSLRIAASQTVATYWLPARMARFAEIWPAISLVLQVSNTREAGAAVLAGDADLGFVEGEVNEPLLDHQIVGGDCLGLFARGDHSLVANKPSEQDLRSAAWVMRERGSGTRVHLAEALGNVGLAIGDLHVRLELPSNGAVLEALAAGGMIGAVSELAAASRIAAGQIARLDWAFPPRPFTRLRHRARRMSNAAEAFLQVCKGAQSEVKSAAIPGNSRALN